MTTKEPKWGLVYRPGEAPQAECIRGFKHLQELCGGYIERVVLDYGRRGDNRWIALWCNEDGMNQRLPLNLLAEGPSYTGAPIFGTAVILAGCRTEDDEEDLGLTDEEIHRWMRLARPIPRPAEVLIIIDNHSAHVGVMEIPFVDDAEGE